MKKIFALTAAAVASGSAVIAGNYTTIPTDTTILEAPQQMGGSGAWLIPLVIVAVLLLALTGDGESQL